MWVCGAAPAAALASKAALADRHRVERLSRARSFQILGRSTRPSFYRGAVNNRRTADRLSRNSPLILRRRYSFGRSCLTEAAAPASPTPHAYLGSVGSEARKAQLRPRGRSTPENQALIVWPPNALRRAQRGWFGGRVESERSATGMGWLTPDRKIIRSPHRRGRAAPLAFRGQALSQSWNWWPARIWLVGKTGYPPTIQRLQWTTTEIPFCIWWPVAANSLTPSTLQESQLRGVDGAHTQTKTAIKFSSNVWCRNVPWMAALESLRA